MKRYRPTALEILVIIGILALLVSIILPSVERYRQLSHRPRCASNLRQIGQAIQLYCNENHGYYPRTTYTPGPVVVPVFGTGTTSRDPFTTSGPAANDVTAAIFLIMRTQEIGPEVFCCDSADATPDKFGGGSNTALNRSNFTEWKKNLSYSFQNPYPNDAVKLDPKGYSNMLSVDFAVAADMNPGIAAATPNLLTVTTRSPPNAFKYANSPNHDGDGQNVLHGDGHVEFHDNPFAGVDRDNIYTSKSGKVNDSPTDDKDSVLLPAKQ